MQSNGKEKPVILVVADCAVDTGFAKVSTSIIKELYRKYDIHVLAINYRGDPHDTQKFAKLWNPTAIMSDDVYGMSRVAPLAKNIEADIIFIINDTWIVTDYLAALKDTEIPKIAYIPVDALNLRHSWIDKLNQLDVLVSYTEFGKREFKNGGYKKDISVIPHGIDKSIFYKVDQQEARKMTALPDDWYVVVNVGRNSPRKRIDLTFYYFSKWVYTYNKPAHVKLYYHGAVQDEGFDLIQLAHYFGIEDRLILTHPNLNPAHGLPEELMRYVYGSADLQFQTTVAEGLTH